MMNSMVHSLNINGTSILIMIIGLWRIWSLFFHTKLQVGSSYLPFHWLVKPNEKLFLLKTGHLLLVPIYKPMVKTTTQGPTSGRKHSSKKITCWYFGVGKPGNPNMGILVDSVGDVNTTSENFMRLVWILKKKCLLMMKFITMKKEMKMKMKITTNWKINTRWRHRWRQAKWTGHNIGQ